jgi:DegV family protein with EDD domain
MRPNISKPCGKSFYYNFIAGAQRILENQKELNSLNVFPVPDADTGSNLASTVRAIIENAVPYHSIKKSAQAIAGAALDGARGNSGVIFAQYLYGFSVEASEGSCLDLKSMAKSLKNAVRYMYEAIADPVEGTMITVIKNWADFLYREYENTENLLHLLIRSCEVARETLRNTTAQIAALKKANVVDAGGKGVVLFLEGMIDFIRDKNFRKVIKVRQESVEIESIEENIDDFEEIKYRYCTEALIKGCEDRDGLKKIAMGWGDSLVIAGPAAGTLRLHVHTDDPAGLFYSLRKTGSISFQKVDDMKKQFEAAHNRKSDIAIVTDSSCDLPRELIDRYQINVTPLNIFFGENHYLDRVTITSDNFYRMLDESSFFPTTSQVNQKTFESIFSRLSTYYKSIIAVHLSGKFSGTYSGSLHAAAGIENETGKRIDVVDSRHVSGSLGLIVLRVARAIEEGQTHEEIMSRVESWIANTRILVSVKTIKYMVRGGRVSRLKGLVSNILNLKPLVSLDPDGKAAVSGKAFSWKGSLNKMLRRIKTISSDKKIMEYCLLHASNPGDASEIACKLEKQLGRKPAYTMDISPVIGLNAGIGAVAVAFITE